MKSLLENPAAAISLVAIISIGSILALASLLGTFTEDESESVETACENAVIVPGDTFPIKGQSWEVQEVVGRGTFGVDPGVSAVLLKSAGGQSWGPSCKQLFHALQTNEQVIP